MSSGHLRFLVAILFYSFSASAIDRVSTGTGNWTDAGTWSPAGVPAIGDNVTVLNGHTVTMDGITGACDNLAVNGTCLNNGTFTVAALSGSGAFTQGAGSTLNISSSSTITTLTATANPNTVNYNGSANQTIKVTPYYNLDVTSTATVTFSAITVNNNFTVVSGIVNVGAGTMSVAGTANISGTLNFTSTTGSKTFAGVTVNSGGTWTAIVTENVTITGSVTTSGTFNCFSGTYSIGGNFSVSGGTTNFEGTISGTLTIASGAIFNASSGNCTVTGTTTVSGTINVTTPTGNKNFSNIIVDVGGTWTSTVAENVTVTGSVTTSGTFECFSGTYSIGSNFFVNGGSTNFEGNIAGNLTVAAGSTFNSSTGILTVSGSTSVSGTLIISTLTSTKSFADVTINSGGVWSCTVAEPLTITGNLTNNGTFTSNTGTYTFSGSGKSFLGNSGITFSGAVSITGSYTNSNAVSVSVIGNLTGTGSLTQGASSTLQIGGNETMTTLTTTANPNTVTYNGAGAQTVRGTTYHHLTINKSANIATAGAAFTCNGNLTLTAGTLASAGFTHTVSGTTTINGGTLSTSNTAGIYNFQSLVMTSGSIAGTVTGAVNVATTLSIPSGSPTIGRCNLTVTGASTIDGSLTFNSVTGTKVLEDVTINSTGTWNSTVARPFTINGNFSNSGTFTANSGTYTFAGAAKTISGTLSIPIMTVTGSYTNNAILTSTTTLNGSGIFSQGSTGTLNVGGTTFSVTTFNASVSGNTVNYDRTAAQNIIIPSDGSYHHLTLSGSGNKTLLAATDINGNLTINSILVASNFNITLGGNWLDIGTFTPGTNTVILDGAAQNISKAGGETFNHLTVSGSGVKTLGSAIMTNGNIIINSTLDVSSSSFGVTVRGNWTNNGTFTARNGDVTFAGTAAQTIGGTAITSFSSITQSNSFGVSLTQNQNLTDALNISAGTFTTTGFNFTLKSTATGTARIAPILTGANFAGNIVMERYTGTGPTDWRFLCPAVSGATIADWTDDFATSGFTGSTDPSSSFVSIHSYDETVPGIADNGYVAATNVSNSISNGKGYWVYLGPNPITYEVTGPPNKFSQSPALTFTSNMGIDDDGWNLIANPYPSAIDWDDSNWSKTNLDDAVYIYNSSNGSFASYAAGVGVNGGSRYIASQQAFWVKANAAGPAISFIENVKATQNPSYLKSVSSPNTSYYPMAFKDFSIPLNVNTVQNSIKLIANGNGFDDETFIRFVQGMSAGFDGDYDAWKMQNLNPSIPNISSVINDSTNLSINTLPALTSDITVSIRMIVPSSGTYSIRRDSVLMLPMSSCIILEDLANGNMIDLRTTISYSFTIADTTSAPRFLLHIYAPISKKSVNASCSNTSNGMAIAKGTGAGPWNYTWKDTSGNVLQTTNNSLLSDTLFNLPVGVYTIEVFGSVCGTVTDTLEVKSLSDLLLVSNLSNVTCNGLSDGTAFVSVSGGLTPYTYAWNTGAITSAVNNLAAGNYFVAVTDVGGCIQTHTVSISQPAILTAGFITDSDTVDLSINNSVLFTDNSSGATTYYWDFGDTTLPDTSQNPVHYYSFVGTYTVTQTVSNGTCSDVFYKTIEVINSPDSGVTAVVNTNTASYALNVVYDKGEIFLVFNFSEKRDAMLSLYNAIGEKILSQEVRQVQNNKIKLQVNNFVQGVYVSVIEMKDAVVAKKLIIH